MEKVEKGEMRNPYHRIQWIYRKDCAREVAIDDSKASVRYLWHIMAVFAGPSLVREAEGKHRAIECEVRCETVYGNKFLFVQ